MNTFSDLPLEEEAYELTTDGMSLSATEERATTSVDAATLTTAGMEVVVTREISQSATEERATPSAAQSTSGAEIVAPTGTGATQRLGAEGNLDHIA